MEICNHEGREILQSWLHDISSKSPVFEQSVVLL